MGAPAVMVCDDGYFRRDKQWRGAGLAAPVFSLATEQSVGVGEFLDLIPLVDLTAAAGLHLIQVGRGKRVHNAAWGLQDMI